MLGRDLVLTKDLNTTRGTYEAFVLTVEARDNGSPSSKSSQHVLAITPVEVGLSPPVLSVGVYADEGTDLPEDTPTNTSLANITCSNAYPFLTLLPTLSITMATGGGTGTGMFSLVGGELVLAGVLDYEMEGGDRFPSVVISCEDQYFSTNSTVLQFTLVNVDDNPTHFVNQTYAASVEENADPDTFVVQVKAFDADNPDALYGYSLPESHGTAFAFEGANLITTTGLDREARGYYNLTVVATPVQNQPLTEGPTNASVLIELLDLNDETPAFDKDVYIVSNVSTNHSSGYEVALVRATDKDVGENSQITYSLINPGPFSINSTSGVIFVSSTSPLVQGSYDLTVRAVDGGSPPLTGSAAVIIEVSHHPEALAFTNASLFAFSVSEDSPRGTSLGHVYARVVDVTGVHASTLQEEVVYSLGNNSQVTHFALAGSTGEIVLLKTLDFESTESYVLHVEASLPAEHMVPMATAYVTVTVEDANDNQPEFSQQLYLEVIDETTPVSSTVVTVSAVDIDSGIFGDVSYRLEEMHDPFQIHPLTGEVFLNGALDEPRDYKFTAVAEDGGYPPSSSEATVFISVVRKAVVSPTFTQSEYTFVVPEGNAIGEEIGVVAAITEGNQTIQESDNISFRIQMPFPTGNGSGELFHIDATKGNISVLTEFDAEMRVDYGFYVELYSSTGNQSLVYDRVPVKVSVMDVNDNTPVFDQSLYTKVVCDLRTQGLSRADGSRPR